VVGVGEAGLVVGSDVTELVRQGLGSLGRLDIVAYPDDTIVETRVSVRSATVTSFHDEAVRFDKVQETFPQAFRGGPCQQLWHDVGQWLAVGLCHIENMDYPKATQFTLSRLLRRR
jgi:hypothetical protein